MAELKSNLIYKFSGIIKKQYHNDETQRGVKFLIEQIKKASCLISDKVYNNLIMALQLNKQTSKTTSLSANQDALFDQIYESKIQNGNNKQNTNCWLDYINFLVHV